jgi:hypothetical protein
VNCALLAISRNVDTVSFENVIVFMVVFLVKRIRFI